MAGTTKQAHHIYEQVIDEDVGDGFSAKDLASDQTRVQRRDGEGEVLLPINDESVTKGHPAVNILCVNIGGFPRPVQLGLLSLGVIFFFQANGWIEEYTFARLPEFHYGWYLTFFELLMFTIFAIFERRASSEAILAHNAPLLQHLGIAVAMTAARGLTNVSLQYLNYPTQVIFKSMKLITVMIASICLLKKTFSGLEYLSAVLLVGAATFFSLGDFSWGSDVKGASRTDNLGIIIVSVSLIADALHSSTQEMVMQKSRASLLETMFWSNTFAAGLAFAYVVLSGELLPAVSYCAVHTVTYYMFVIRAFVIYCGVLCFASIIKHFDAVTATTITTLRKIITILLSFITFPKPFSINYVYGTLLFMASLAATVQHLRNRPK